MGLGWRAGKKTLTQEAELPVHFFTQMAAEGLQTELHLWQFPIDVSTHLFFPQARIPELMIRATAATNCSWALGNSKGKGLSERQVGPQSPHTPSPRSL